MSETSNTISTDLTQSTPTTASAVSSQPEVLPAHTEETSSEPPTQQPQGQDSLSYEDVQLAEGVSFAAKDWDAFKLN